MEASIQARKPLFFAEDLTECPYSGLHQGVARTSEHSFMNGTDAPVIGTLLPSHREPELAGARWPQSVALS